MHDLMDMYPEIKRFGGYRRSGAGAGRVQEIEPFRRDYAKAVANPKPELAHEDYRMPSYNADGKTVPAVRVFDPNTGETLSVARATPFENKESRIKRAYDEAKKIIGDESGALRLPKWLYKEKARPDLDGSPDGDQALVGRLIDAVKKAEPVRTSQEKLYAKERGSRVHEAAKMGKFTSGEEGFHAELSKLGGPMPKAQWESIRDQFEQPEIDRLFDMVKENPRLTFFEKINARTALSKMLGAEGTAVPTKSELSCFIRFFLKS